MGQGCTIPISINDFTSAITETADDVYHILLEMKASKSVYLFLSKLKGKYLKYLHIIFSKSFYIRISRNVWRK